MAVRTIDKIIDVEAWRFQDAIDRLEQLRGISNARDKLLSRMTAKKGVWNLIASSHGMKFTFTDYGMEE